MCQVLPVVGRRISAVIGQAKRLFQAGEVGQIVLGEMLCVFFHIAWEGFAIKLQEGRGWKVLSDVMCRQRPEDILSHQSAGLGEARLYGSNEAQHNIVSIHIKTITSLLTLNIAKCGRRGLARIEKGVLKKRMWCHMAIISWHKTPFALCASAFRPDHSGILFSHSIRVGFCPDFDKV